MPVLNKMDGRAEKPQAWGGLGRAERRVYAGGANMRRHTVELLSPELELMKSVMANSLKDYLNGIGVSGDSKKAREVTGKAKTALIWIKETNRTSTHYVFGFIFICKIIGLDPDRFRKKILGIQTRDDIERLRERYFDLDKRNPDRRNHESSPDSQL